MKTLTDYDRTTIVEVARSITQPQNGNDLLIQAIFGYLLNEYRAGRYASPPSHEVFDPYIQAIGDRVKAKERAEICGQLAYGRMQGLSIGDQVPELLGGTATSNDDWIIPGPSPFERPLAPPMPVLPPVDAPVILTPLPVPPPVEPRPVPAPPLTPAPPDAPAFHEQTNLMGPIWDTLRGESYTVQVTVKNVRFNDGTEIDKPKPGYLFAVVDIIVLNVGPDAIHGISDGNFQMLDADGALHNSDLMSTPGDCRMDYVDLLRNGTIKGCIGYEVPKEGKLAFVYAPYQHEGLKPGRHLSFAIR